MFPKLLIYHFAKNKYFKIFSQGILCLGCRSAASYILDKRRNENATDDFVKNLARDICVLFEIMPEDVCNGLVELNAVSI